jgi:hypothetical protein
VGITANPYGVGASGASREKVTGRCSCCGLLYWYERWPGGSTGPYCEHCLEHVQQPDELETTTLARLRDHEPRLQRYADYAGQRATQYEKEAKAAKAEGSRQAASALRQRDDYQALLAEVYVLHADKDGRCKACSTRFPCATINLLERAPRAVSEGVVRAAATRDPDAPG